MNENYLYWEADGNHAAMYYYSCWCGEKGNALYSFGERIPSSITSADRDEVVSQQATDPNATIIIVNTPTSLSKELFEWLSRGQLTQSGNYYYYNYYYANADVLNGEEVSTGTNTKQNEETPKEKDVNQIEEKNKEEVIYKTISCDSSSPLMEHQLEPNEIYRISISGYSEPVTISVDDLADTTIRLFQDAEMKQEIQLENSAVLLLDYYLDGTVFLQVTTRSVPILLSVQFNE